MHFTARQQKTVISDRLGRKRITVRLPFCSALKTFELCFYVVAVPFSTFVPRITVHFVNEIVGKMQGRLQRAEFVRLSNLPMLPKP